MKKHFNDYAHYSRWLLENWDRSAEFNKVIVQEGLVGLKPFTCNGNPYRQLNKEEFNACERFIPILNH